jgi:hypothetical protein
MKNTYSYIINAALGVRTLFILAAFSILLLVVPPMASATFQWPSTAAPYRLGAAPVPNAGLRAHNESIMTGPDWWRKTRQPRYQNPTILHNPYWDPNQR